MSLRQTDDPALIRARLDAAVADDPVRHTLLGTLAATLGEGAWLGEWDGGLAARSSADFPVVLAGDPGDDGPELLERLRTHTGLPALNGRTEVVRTLVATLPADAVLDERADRLFRLDDLREPTVPGRAVLATPAELTHVAEWYAAFVAEAGLGHTGHHTDAHAMAARLIEPPGCLLWLDPDDRPVAMAARRPAVAGSARIGPVFTPPAERGHGYASGATAAATRSILAEGAVPVLFTDLANPTSNRIYQALGYEAVEDRLVVTLR